LFPNIELAGADGWKLVEAKGKRKMKRNLWGNVSMYDNYTYLVQAAPEIVK